MSKDSHILAALAPVEAIILQAASSAARGINPLEPPRGVSLHLLSHLVRSGHLRWDSVSARYRLTWGGIQRLRVLQQDNPNRLPLNPVLKDPRS